MATAKKKSNSPWPIYSILILFIGFFLGTAILTEIHPEYFEGVAKARLTQRNFNEALVTEAPMFADKFPLTIVVPFRNPAGDLLSKDVTVYGYSIHPGGYKCVQYYYPAEPASLKLGCTSPEQK